MTTVTGMMMTKERASGTRKRGTVKRCSFQLQQQWDGSPCLDNKRARMEEDGRLADPQQVDARVRESAAARELIQHDSLCLRNLGRSGASILAHGR